MRKKTSEYRRVIILFLVFVFALLSKYCVNDTTNVYVLWLCVFISFSGIIYSVLNIIRLRRDFIIARYIRKIKECGDIVKIRHLKLELLAFKRKKLWK